MLKRRIIPKLLVVKKMIRGVPRFALVTTHQFQKQIIVGDPVSQAKIYQNQLADELLILRIDKEIHVPEFKSLLQEMTKEISIPITVGGGLRSIRDVGDMLHSGADKVSLNTLALKEPEILREACRIFGSQSIIANIDYRNCNGSLNAEVYENAGSLKTGISIYSHIESLVSAGVGEIIVNSIERDGTKSGLDINIARKLAKEFRIPFIFSGGCGKASHFIDFLRDGTVDAIAAGTFFCHRDQNPIQTRARIANSGIPVRVS